MTEHEKIKTICDKIGCEILKDDLRIIKWFDDEGTKSYGFKINGVGIRLNIREVIFTQEFMTNFLTYCLKIGKRNIGEIKIEIINNLDNPVEYLYNLIELCE